MHFSLKDHMECNADLGVMSYTLKQDMLLLVLVARYPFLHSPLLMAWVMNGLRPKERFALDFEH